MIRRWRIYYALMLFIVLSLAAAHPLEARTTIQDEIRIGQESAVEVEREFPVTDNKQWLAEIDQMGKKLTVNVKRKEIPYSFKIIKEQVAGKNEIDAFSLPGGPVYFSERLWRLLTYDERMGVLAHEIAHVDKRHAIDTMSEMNKRRLWSMLVFIITGVNGSIVDAADIANTLYTLKYTRKREKEADLMAVDFCVQSNISPVGLITALDKIRRLEDESGDKPIRFLSTHPDTKSRIDYLTKRCNELGINPDTSVTKYDDQPDRLGSVSSKSKDAKTITVLTTKGLTANEEIWIKKPLWDDASGKVMPKSVAYGFVVTGGTNATVFITMISEFEYEDIEIGDGVYPRKVAQDDDRVGSISSTSKDTTLVTVTATRGLHMKQDVWIRKQVWDDITESFVTKQIAKGTVLTPGFNPGIAVSMEPGYDYKDIEPGDGVYLRDPEPEKPAPDPAATSSKVT